MYILELSYKTEYQTISFSLNNELFTCDNLPILYDVKKFSTFYAKTIFIYIANIFTA